MQKLLYNDTAFDVMFIIKIWLYILKTLSPLQGVKTGLRIFLLSLFLYGQAASISHAHEHHDEVPHKTCEVCILAVNDEDDGLDELKVPDGLDGPAISDVYNIVSAPLRDVSFREDHHVERHNFGRLTPELASKSSRAPPLH